MNPSNCQLSHGWCGGIFPAASSGFPSPQNFQTPRPHPRRASHRRLRAPASPQRSPGSAGAPSPSPGTLVSAASALGLKQLLCHSATVRARPRPRARGLSGGGGRRGRDGPSGAASPCCCCCAGNVPLPFPREKLSSSLTVAAVLPRSCARWFPCLYGSRLGLGRQ